MVHERIKRLRVASGMTQEELGAKLGVGKATVQKYESGQIQNLKTAHIKTLCRLFKKRPHYFIFDDLEKYECESDNLHEKIESTYGAMLSATLKIGFRLNEKGRARLLDYAYDLAKIEEYKK